MNELLVIKIILLDTHAQNLQQQLCLFKYSTPGHTVSTSIPPLSKKLFQRKLGNTMISKKQDNAKKHCVDDGMDNFTSLDGQCNNCSGDQHVKKGKDVKKRKIVHFGIL